MLLLLLHQPHPRDRISQSPGFERYPQEYHTYYHNHIYHHRCRIAEGDWRRGSGGSRMEGDECQRIVVGASPELYRDTYHRYCYYY